MCVCVCIYSSAPSCVSESGHAYTYLQVHATDSVFHSKLVNFITVSSTSFALSIFGNFPDESRSILERETHKNSERKRYEDRVGAKSAETYHSESDSQASSQS